MFDYSNHIEVEVFYFSIHSIKDRFSILNNFFYLHFLFTHLHGWAQFENIWNRAIRTILNIIRVYISNFSLVHTSSETGITVELIWIRKHRSPCPQHQNFSISPKYWDQHLHGSCQDFGIIGLKTHKKRVKQKMLRYSVITGSQYWS